MWGLLRRRPVGKLALLAVIALVCVQAALALNPERHISQYGHTSWRTRDGAFDGMPVILAQTTDGYLWIGTNIGLVRFDGVHFSSWKPSPGERLFDPRIFSLLATRDGSLWIGTGYGLARLHNGTLTHYPQIGGRIESLVEGKDGTVWLIRNQMTDEMGPLCSIKNEQAKCFGAQSGIPFRLAIRLQKGVNDDLWVGGYDALCRWKDEACTAYFAQNHHAETFASLRAIAPAPDGTVWAAIDQPSHRFQLQHFINGSWSKRDIPALPFSNADVTTLYAERDNVLWIGTSHHGIWRIRGEEVDHFGNADGLSSDSVEGFYGDAEGTLWVTTSEGIDNFRDLRVTSFSTREGLSAAGASSIIAASDGTVWIGNFQSLDALRGKTITSIRPGQGLPGSNVTTMHEDHAGRLWLGVDDGLWVYTAGQFHPVRKADGSALGIVFAIAEDTHRDIWVRAGPNLDRIDENLSLQNQTTSPQIATAYSMAANPKGGVVLGLVNGDLVEFENGKATTLSAAGSDNSRQVRDMLVDSDGSIWGTTLDGVFRFKDGQRKYLNTLNGLPCDGIFALVKDAANSLWIYSKCGLISVSESQLGYWWDHPGATVSFTLLDALDGVSPGLTSLKPQTARSSNGSLWFVNGQLLQTLDPRIGRLNNLPPPVHIEEIIAGHKTYLGQDNLRLPALTRDLEIRYAALSFIAPQKVQFRYKLENHDSDWQEPGNRREAFYNDLRPGKYTFRVVASNNDGVWNETGADLDFTIEPAWFQTIWFRLIAVLIALAVVWTLYQLRLRQLQQQFSIGLEARIHERTRIARELHDTLLQNFQGVLFLFQAASDQFKSGSTEAKRSLDRAIERAVGAISEGRAAVQGLRVSATETNSLAAALTALGLELSSEEPSQRPELQVHVEGEARDLHPILRDEVYRIASEALRNAFLHSRAHNIDVKLVYNDQQFVLQIRDDGAGIDPQIVADKGRAGHWGLRGMYERAKIAGGNLEINSRTGSGTQIELRIPASKAYAKSPRS